MKNSDSDRQRFRNAAREIYDQQLREKLEAEHRGKVIALEPESGQFVMGATFDEISTAHRAKFGTKPVYILRIGGGSVVRPVGAVHGRTT